jgi:DNA-binding SARP family transcriptional activator/TolB-like protein
MTQRGKTSAAYETGVAPTSERLAISVLGRMRVDIHGQELRFKSRKSRAALAYLALNDDSHETRERLVGLLWSESEEEKARASLRQIVHDLRETLRDAGYGGLQSARLDIELDPTTISVDLWDVLRSAESHAAHPLILDVPRIADTLLQDFDDIDPSFRMWLLAKRQTVHDRLLRHLEAGLQDGAATREMRTQLAQAILNLDPTHEEACRMLMQSRAAAGDTAGALRAYEALWTLLGDEHDMEPSAATQKLVADIKQGRFETTAAEGAPASAEPAAQAARDVSVSLPETRPSVPARISRPTKVALIVEPFGLNGVEPDRTHLVEGFRHHLIACLVRFREWYVVDRSMQATDAGRTSSVSTNYAIEAVAYQAGRTINMVLTLRERDANIYVWSERFELDLESWFSIQQRIVHRIAMSLNVQLSIERLMRLAGEPDVSLEIYDRWLRGQQMIDQCTPDSWARAAQIFAETIGDAPEFSLAYSSLVDMNNVAHIAHPGVLRDPTKAAATLELARKAVAFDAIDSRAQLCLGWSLAMSGRHEQAAVHMELARELNPYSSWTIISTALFHAFCGEFDLARRLADQSLKMTLTPSLPHWGYQASSLFLSGDYAGAIEAADRAQDIFHTLPAWRAAALHHLGRHDEARMDAQRFLAGIRTRWCGTGAPTDEAIGRWLLHVYPIKKAEHWECLRAGVAGAGIPVVGIEHGAWWLAPGAATCSA